MTNATCTNARFSINQCLNRNLLDENLPSASDKDRKKAKNKKKYVCKSINRQKAYNYPK